MELIAMLPATTLLCVRMARYHNKAKIKTRRRVRFAPHEARRCSDHLEAGEPGITGYVTWDSACRLPPR
jgi:hypothetical protein